MSEKDADIAADPTDLAEHPAFVAWKRVNEESAPPTKIETLEKKGNVLRLVGVGPGHSNVIAKRSRKDQCMVENYIYKHILPDLTLSSPTCYGRVKGFDRDYLGDRNYWLFIEDAGDEFYSSRLEDHQVLVSKWLGELHTSASHLPNSDFLPDRSPAWFLEHLRSIRSEIRRQQSIWATFGDDASVEIIVGHCDSLESRWHEIELACEEVPSTLVHCDFVPKNICVRPTSNGKVLLPFDWEMAGWGNPAPDIAHLVNTYGTPLPSSQLINDPDGNDCLHGIHAYWATVRECWPHLNLHTFERLALVGQIFRMLFCIGWSLESIKSMRKKLSIKRMRKKDGTSNYFSGYQSLSMGETNIALPQTYLERPLAQLRCYQTGIGSALGYIKRGHLT